MIPGIPGGWEIIIVLFVALLIFGPKQLPKLANSLGRSITELKDGLKKINEPMDSEEDKNNKD